MTDEMVLRRKAARMILFRAASLGRHQPALRRELEEVARLVLNELPGEQEPRPGPMYPPLHPWDLEPHYCAHIAAMTAEGLHSKAAIAEQLAWRDQQLDALRRIVARTLACGQLEKLEDARDYLGCHVERAGVRRSKREAGGT